MELNNEFTVPVSQDRAWAVLTDIEGIAPCMPGAQLQEVEGDEFRGIVKVKVGPITAEYKGAAVIESKDEGAGRMVINASGRDTRGQGNASAMITVQLVGEGDDRTKVSVDTDLSISGKVAQFGRGMLADVSTKLLDQFVVCLEGKLEEEPPEPEVAIGFVEADEAVADVAGEPDVSAPVADAPAPAAASAASNGTAPKAAPTVRKINSPEAQPVDLGNAAGGAVAKRAVPALFILILLLLINRRRKS